MAHYTDPCCLQIKPFFDMLFKCYVHFFLIFISNTELSDLKKNVCLRKSEVSDEITSVCYTTENLAEHGIHCPTCSYTNDVINILP